MFELEHHQKIQQILKCLDADFFKEIGAYFGGGTLLSLRYGEYRWSKDIDFICPVGKGYKALRLAVMDKGYEAIFKSRQGIELPREIKADQYGIRFAVVVDETVIKFEIVAEARIQLDAPIFLSWSLIPCLGFIDSCAEKLLANADRWNDSSIESRDLIDLAMLRLQAAIPEASYVKAEDAYPVRSCLQKAVIAFQQKSDYRKSCFKSLQVKNLAQVIDGLDLLAQDFGLPLTVRIDKEHHVDEYGLPLQIEPKHYD
ncbi:MAG TPA: nucleotidyl transferase AbiEii/AbiGii toxin family protein [Agitococcus sp.]|nr:nucleotidyl transferase AbiEii/AbiGii toxin family protein [Agitococcus sp.]